MNVQELTFPEEEFIVTKNQLPKVQIPPALKFITSLLYKSGAGLTIAYFLSIFIIQPLLEIQYERRNEFIAYVLHRARRLLNTLSLKRNLPVVAIRRGDKLYSDASVQTIDSKEQKKEKELELRNSLKYGVTFEDQVDGDVNKKNLIKNELLKLKDSLIDYNKDCCSLNEINPFIFQLKKFQGNIEAYRHANIFKTGRHMAGTSSGTAIKNDIRTIKGWYLTGQV